MECKRSPVCELSQGSGNGLWLLPLSPLVAGFQGAEDRSQGKWLPCPFLLLTFCPDPYIPPSVCFVT